MTRIIDLSAASAVAAGDNVPFWSATNGDSRRASMTAICDYVQTQISGNDDKITQYAAPAVNAFTVAITNGSASIWLVMTPTAGFANGTIRLPAVANCIEKQEVAIVSTQAVAALVVDGNGATVVGAPTALLANGYFTLRYDDHSTTWYRIG